ncbi:hypothetical protein QBC47DRAFT_356807 [Echria macrotheca]|uniref:Uncharacterized protein n=1 Tax=Echria macrotheca TaxID=438768 RepID=A0AAJ0FF74_9PEZI|nr:hypothetical protein QBC47DRAFT_356807 [Echria macrotheca]
MINDSEDSKVSPAGGPTLHPTKPNSVVVGIAAVENTAGAEKTEAKSADKKSSEPKTPKAPNYDEKETQYKETDKRVIPDQTAEAKPETTETTDPREAEEQNRDTVTEAEIERPVNKYTINNYTPAYVGGSGPRLAPIGLLLSGQTHPNAKILDVVTQRIVAPGIPKEEAQQVRFYVVEQTDKPADPKKLVLCSKILNHVSALELERFEQERFDLKERVKDVEEELEKEPRVTRGKRKAALEQARAGDEKKKKLGLSLAARAWRRKNAARNALLSSSEIEETWVSKDYGSSCCNANKKMRFEIDLTKDHVDQPSPAARLVPVVTSPEGSSKQGNETSKISYLLGPNKDNSPRGSIQDHHHNSTTSHVDSTQEDKQHVVAGRKYSSRGEVNPLVDQPTIFPATLLDLDVPLLLSSCVPAVITPDSSCTQWYPYIMASNPLSVMFILDDVLLLHREQ